MDYSKHLAKKNTSPTEPLFGESMVKNNAGGYVYSITAKQQLERFLILGTEGGTYYCKEQSLTVENAKSIIELIKNEGQTVLNVLKDVVSQKRAPKMDPALFVLALLCTYGNETIKQHAYSMISTTCKTSTHLFTFLSNVKNIRGYSRGLRSGIAKFYTSKTNDQIAYQITKYRSRNGYTHKDALRLSHPKALTQDQNKIFSYIVGKASAEETDNDLIVAVETALKTTESKDLVNLINEFKLTWEMIPTEKLNDKEVLKALLPNMPLNAMIRNLNRMSAAGLFDSNTSNETKYVVSQLTNKEVVAKSGLHPVNLLNMMYTYERGYGHLGKLTWDANQKIVSAMETAFNNSFETLKPSGKNLLIAVDVSGSMSAVINNMAINCKQAGAALSLAFVKSEPNVDLIWFDTQVYKPKTGPHSSYTEVLANTPNGGGTDCSLAFQYALKTKVKYDGIIIITDNETWVGKTHASVLLNDYRKKVNKDVKVVNIGMSATNYSVTDANLNNLHVAGFDASIPEVINSFV